MRLEMSLLHNIQYLIEHGNHYDINCNHHHLPGYTVRLPLPTSPA